MKELDQLSDDLSALETNIYMTLKDKIAAFHAEHPEVDITSVDVDIVNVSTPKRHQYVINEVRIDVNIGRYRLHRGR